MKPRSSSSTQSAVWLLLVVAAGCAASPEPPSEAGRPIRLVEHLAAAKVESPLIGLPAARTIPDLGTGVRRKTTWQASLEGLASGSGCRLGEHPGRPGEALHCPSGQFESFIPVEPLTRYRVRLQVFRPRHGCLEAVVEERFADGAKLWSHRFPALDPGVWTEAEVHFRTSAEIQQLRVMVGRCEVWLGELTAMALDLTPEQELALLKAEHPAPGADPELGILKRGLLLPGPDPKTAAPPADGNYTVRDAFFAPAPTDLAFDLQIPAEARLDFSYALSGDSSPGDRADFRVAVRPRRGGERQLWHRTLELGPAGEGWLWHHERLDLAAFAGRRVRLTLSTRSPDRRGHALWGNPVIDAPATPASEAPNVILIAVDTLRADRLSSYGHPVETSPHVDALARDGIRFDQAMSPFCHTAESFSSLLTGYGAVDSPMFIPAGRATLASHFRAAGWTTGAIAYKPMLYSGGYDQGFDHYFNVPREASRAVDNVRKALDWLDLNQDRRFFLLLHLNDPHQPFCQPAERTPGPLRDRLAAFGLALPVEIKTKVRGRPVASPEVDDYRTCGDCVETKAFHAVAHDLYDDAVAYADEQIGVFLRALEQRGLYREAVIAFVSDHGEGLWLRDRLFTHGSSLDDGATRVPLIVKPAASAGWARGKVVRSQVRHFDLMPTLLELAGLDPAALPIDGRSLVPMLRQGTDPTPQDRTAVLLQPRMQVGAVRRGGWKYLGRFRAPSREWLFDLAQDPGERRNVAAQHPEMLRSLRQEFLEDLLAARSGQTLLVTGDPPAEEYSIEVTWDREVSLLPFAYPPGGEPGLSAEGFPRVEYSGVADSRVLLLARFEAPEGVRVDVALRDGGPSPRLLAGGLEVDRGLRYRRGMLSRLLQTPGERAVVFRGSSAVPAAPEPETVDERQIEALRAMGYVQ